MVQKFEIPWSAWYGNEKLELKFPDSWEVSLYKMNGASPIKDTKPIEDALDAPIGTPPIHEVAKSKRDAVIVIDDISRPTRAEKILEVLIPKLNSAGISNEKITIIFATGAHRPLNRTDIIKKVGKKFADTLNIENHHPYENLVYLGESSYGTPIYLNRTYYEAGVKIAIGAVLPHPLAGFGGGAKIILPGISGIKTLEANHQAGVRGIGIGLGFITELRKDIEEVCEKVGLDFSINVIPTINREIAGIFAGHFIEAHRRAVEFAKKVYYTKVPSNLKLDIGFFNLYPEDTELSQSSKGFNIFLSTKKLIHRKGAVIFLTSATEGRGFHSLLGETGCKLYYELKNTWEMVIKNVLAKNVFGIFSPNVNEIDVRHFYPDNTILFRDFNSMIKKLEEIYGDSPKSCIFPSSMQILSNK